MLDTAATVTAKGQVTIPAEMRRALGIRPHDRVRLEVEDAGSRCGARAQVGSLEGDCQEAADSRHDSGVDRADADGV